MSDRYNSAWRASKDLRDNICGSLVVSWESGLEQESKEMRDVAELSSGHPKEHLDNNPLSLFML